MVSKKLLDQILHKEEKLSKRWAEEVEKSEHMKTYQHYSVEELIRRNKKFFENLANWLDTGVPREGIGLYFVDVGKQRYREGFPLPEIIYGVFLAKKVFYDVLISEAVLSSAVEMYQALELITMIYNYFDLGNFYITRGYLEEMFTKIGKAKKFTDDEIKQYFFPGSFYKPDIPFA